jgi:hypothetical protein
MSQLPWEVHPDLAADRLTVLAELIAAARGDVVAAHNPEIGDDEWVLGCRGFQASRYRITQAAASGEYPWLTIDDPSRHYVFKVGKVPVRFYRGEPEDPNTRTKRQSFPELAQLSLAFPEENVRELRDLVYRLAVETDFDGQVAMISFVGLVGESIFVNWRIPLDPTAATVTVMKPRAPGVVLAPPMVEEPGAVTEVQDEQK